MTESLIGSPITLASTYQDLGGVIDVRGRDTVSIWVDCTPNNSDWLVIRLYGLLSETGDEFAFTRLKFDDVVYDNLNNVSYQIDLQQSNFDGQKMIYTFEIGGSVPYVKAKVRVFVPGATPGTIDNAYITTG